MIQCLNLNLVSQYEGAEKTENKTYDDFNIVALWSSLTSGDIPSIRVNSHAGRNIKMIR